MHHDVAKRVRLLNLEKDELTQSLNETESALEAGESFNKKMDVVILACLEEGKVLRLQTEVSQIRQEIDRRIQEKEEDFENVLTALNKHTL